MRTTREIRSVLRQQADTHEVAGNRLQHRKALHQSERGRGCCQSCFILGNVGRYDHSVRYPLTGLSKGSRQPAPKLDLAKRCHAHPSSKQRLGKNPTGGDRVLHG